MPGLRFESHLASNPTARDAQVYAHRHPTNNDLP
jgi:hypothetical protein